MQEKKPHKKILPVPELKSQVTEILVANGRSFQPFIRTFHYTGENISKSNLGTLIGVFEIDEMNEDCAYIVNFLASVAKKEYFSNPRRGAVESFEAALHKINLALSELVKHGNIAWLGKLHGTLGVLEKNNIHFSVTGQASILLIRNDGISDISTGLASEESHIHPIKTFVEVSSGRLSLADRILLTSPELLALFSLEELTRNARRMDNEQFLQFLKTALVNELDMAGTILIDVSEEYRAVIPKAGGRPTEEKSLERVSNIFSQSAFAPKKAVEISDGTEHVNPSHDQEEAPNEEYTDTKTGHIYVQGDTPKEPGKHAKFDHFILGFEEWIDTSRSFVLSQGKWFRKGKKQLVLVASLAGESLHSTQKRIGRALRRKWRTYRTAKATPLPLPEKESVEPITREAPKAIFPVSDIPLPQETSLAVEHAPSLVEENEHTSKPADGNELPHFIKEKLNSFYQKNKKISLPFTVPASLPTKGLFQNIPILKNARDTMRRLFSKALAQGAHFSSSSLTPLTRKTCSFYRNLSDKNKYLVFGSVIAIFVLTSGWYLWPDNGPKSDGGPDASEDPLRTALSQTESNIPTSGELTVVLEDVSLPIIGSVVLNEEVYVISEQAIFSIRDKKSYTLPNNSRASFATAMDDLRLIFIATEKSTLYAWSPISKTFVENTLSLADNATIGDIDTYLTYLYVLDSTNDQVYRFPRADGGFGASTLWLKESVSIDTSSRLAVNESLYIALDTRTIKGYFRGRQGNNFESPADLTVIDLYTHPGLQNVYALDSEHERIIIWNQDGKLLKELTHEKFSEGKTLSVNEKDGEIFISTEDALLLYKLK